MLDENGFKKKTYADLIDEMEAKAKELFGEKINLSSRSFLGILLRLFAWFLAQVWELAESVYYSAYPTKADRVQLDRLTPFFATKRNIESVSTVTLNFTGTSNHIIDEGKRYETPSGLDFSLTQDVSLDINGIGSGIAVCLTPGTIGNVESGTITIQSEPDADVLTVTNQQPATGGRDYENDPVLLNRLQNSTGTNGSATTDAIVSAVREAAGVRSANISVNRTNVESNGLPPKSFQVFTLGGDSQAIAEAIFSKMAGGIEPYGTIQIDVTDSSGNPQAISFSPAIIVDVFMEVTIKTDNSFGVDGKIQIQDEIIKVIGGTDSGGVTYSGLNMGNSVIVFQVEKAIGNVVGVIDASVAMGRDWDTLVRNNLAIGSDEVAQVSNNHISVVET